MLIPAVCCLLLLLSISASVWRELQRFRGNHPFALGQPDLSELYLSSNKLTGTISPAVGGLRKLAALDLHGNIAPQDLFLLKTAASAGQQSYSCTRTGFLAGSSRS